MAKGTNARYLKNLSAMQALMRRRDGPSNTEVQKGITQLRAKVAAGLGIGYEGATSRFGGGAGGIASPVTEPSASTRTFHAVPRRIASTDGVFEIEILDIRSLDMVDAGGGVVQFFLAQPS